MDFLIRFIADYLVVIIVAVGGIAYIRHVRHDVYQRYAQGIMAGLMSLTVGKLMSLLYTDSVRPFVAMGVEPRAAYLDNPGFPSDHALFVATITLIVWRAGVNRRLVVVLAFLSLAVCAGRVIALVHTPADVVGGVAAAFIGVLGWSLMSGKQKRVR